MFRIDDDDPGLDMPENGQKQSVVVQRGNAFKSRFFPGLLRHRFSREKLYHT
jgi:hypothetical protein